MDPNGPPSLTHCAYFFVIDHPLFPDPVSTVSWPGLERRPPAAPHLPAVDRARQRLFAFSPRLIKPSCDAYSVPSQSRLAELAPLLSTSMNQVALLIFGRPHDFFSSLFFFAEANSWASSDLFICFLFQISWTICGPPPLLFFCIGVSFVPGLKRRFPLAPP